MYFCQHFSAESNKTALHLKVSEVCDLSKSDKLGVVRWWWWATTCAFDTTAIKSPAGLFSNRWQSSKVPLAHRRQNKVLSIVSGLSDRAYSYLRLRIFLVALQKNNFRDFLKCTTCKINAKYRVGHLLWHSAAVLWDFFLHCSDVILCVDSIRESTKCNCVGGGAMQMGKYSRPFDL